MRQRGASKGGVGEDIWGIGKEKSVNLLPIIGELFCSSVNHFGEPILLSPKFSNNRFCQIRHALLIPLLLGFFGDILWCVPKSLFHFQVPRLKNED